MSSLMSENTTLEIPNRGINVINESGLYSLILRSRKKKAKQFKKWVTSEVLPSIESKVIMLTALLMLSRNNMKVRHVTICCPLSVINMTKIFLK